MMETYRFRRNLYVNDSDPALDRPRGIWEADSWAIAIDGKFVSQVDKNGQWWVGQCKVNADWCEKTPKLHKIKEEFE